MFESYNWILGKENAYRNTHTHTKMNDIFGLR